jgi:SNF2 family DNA or RNA helicase
LYCDLEPPQRALYNELRDHYRASLLGKVARDGLGRAKLQVLEALLRLRQAACHPGLVDRATRDRQARVERFQGNGCPLFLSLKANGLGLNLTTAEYVFLLEPWWNPAVEAQAIDRAHRIGQTRPVFAFRLIARDTVEEKVLELQATKRRLADAIVRADESLIRDLRREDLELLLS